MVDTSAAFRHEGDVEQDVRSRLRWDVRVDDSLINVRVLEGGRVMLSGTVGSLAEKRQAEMLAHVEGASSVDTAGLEVARWARDDDLRRGKYADVSDSGISAAIQAALAHDPRVDASRIDVEVEDHDVWLRGDVTHAEARRSATQDAYNTVGVDYVVDRLRVRPESLDDATIENLLESSLRSRDLLDGAGIEVHVRDRAARLTGDVSSLADYWLADQAASAVRGLEALTNDLTVRGRKPQIWSKWYGFYPRPTSPGVLPNEVSDITDRQIYADVRDELFWSPFVDLDDISVSVDDGIVTLSGTVGSARELEYARQNALEGGALDIRNELKLVN
jgi:osmotically-inducible protein OsmY